MLICRLAGITDLYAKIVGSTNPLNIVRATMKALTSQVSLHVRVMVKILNFPVYPDFTDIISSLLHTLNLLIGQFIVHI